MEKKSLGEWLVIAGLGIVFGCVLLSFAIAAVMLFVGGDVIGGFVMLTFMGLVLAVLGLCLNDD